MGHLGSGVGLALGMPRKAGTPPKGGGTQTRAQKQKVAKEKVEKKTGNTLVSPVFKSKAGTIPKPVHRPSGPNKRKLEADSTLEASHNASSQSQNKMEVDQPTAPIKESSQPAKKVKTGEPEVEILEENKAGGSAEPTETQEHEEGGAVETAEPKVSVHEKAAAAGFHRASAILAARRQRYLGPRPKNLQQELLEAEGLSSPDAGSGMTIYASGSSEVTQTVRKRLEPSGTKSEEPMLKLDFTPALQEEEYDKEQKALFDNKLANTTPAECTVDISPIKPHKESTGSQDSLDLHLSRALELAQSVKKGTQVHDEVQLREENSAHEQQMKEDPIAALTTKNDCVKELRISITNLEQHIRSKIDYISSQDRVVLIEVKNDLTKRLQTHCLVRGHLFNAEGKRETGGLLLDIGQRLQNRLDAAMTLLATVPKHYYHRKDMRVF